MNHKNANMQIVITGLGMVTSIGLDVKTSCASARAGLERKSELELEIVDEQALEMESLTGNKISLITDGFDGVGRLVQLGVVAIEDLLKYSDLEQNELSNTGMAILLRDNYYQNAYLQRDIVEDIDDDHFRKEIYTDFEREYKEQFRVAERSLIKNIESYSNIFLKSKLKKCFFGGTADFMSVIDFACTKLRHNEVQRFIIGGIDSLIEGHTLEALNSLGLLHTVENEYGFIPGEAAAFVMLERHDAAVKRDALIEGVLVAQEKEMELYHRFSRKTVTGEALSQTIERCLRHSNIGRPASSVALGIGNINGDPFYAKEYGNTLVRMKGVGLPVDFVTWSTASSFGEIGVAAGPSAICVGIRAFAGGYARGENILIWLLSENASRGACVISKFKGANG
ncbi:MAG: hypothetical protein HKP58_03145 [Desulfatitalea sp.]|nr:hypothetical protein [Desulfatitalea sp.]NNJ99388.1 hypothetical protein [Desulfatitalea sp.]